MTDTAIHTGRVQGNSMFAFLDRHASSHTARAKTNDQSGKTLLTRVYFKNGSARYLGVNGGNIRYL